MKISDTGEELLIKRNAIDVGGPKYEVQNNETRNQRQDQLHLEFLSWPPATVTVRQAVDLYTYVDIYLYTQYTFNTS